ncbi:MAG TPA: hypothetical protein VIC28_18175 [Thermoanaerobaculia bacterium]|jgi:hypothetical protein
MMRNALSTSLLLLCLCGCGGDQSAAVPQEAPTADATSAAPSPSADSAPVGPISSRGEVVADGTSPQAQGGSIDFDVPAGWQSQPPSSNMRLVQAAIPGPGGNGEFAVFYFGPGGGGPVEANIDRWVGQMESAAKPAPETFEANGYKVTWIDVRGNLKANSMGMSPSAAQANARLFGAVVEGPGGPWFFKATGPEATMAPAREAFVAMLKSVRGK